jgi:dTDP-4-amino-4,6-dideoxygalactose transaminase
MMAREASVSSVPLSRPWISEEEALAAADVVRSGWLISGPRVEEFEHRFAEMVGARHAVAVSSGSAALLVAYSALGISSGDEILVPDMTFVSTATAAHYLGARPVFVDIELRSYGVDPSRLEQAIGPRTRAIVPVHYAGQTAEMEPILSLARARGLPVVEDAAEAHLSEYAGRRAGTLGDVGIFSFTPSKPMTTGEGGLLVTDDEALAQRARRIRDFGDTGKFQWDGPGLNFRMPEVMGAIGLVQLGRVKEAVTRRRRIAADYDRAFSSCDALITPWARSGTDVNYQLYTLRLETERLRVDRDGVMALLGERGIATRLYFPALHRQKVFAGSPASGHYPNATCFEQTALSLPIYPTMSQAEVDAVVRSVLDVVAEVRR